MNRKLPHAIHPLIMGVLALGTLICATLMSGCGADTTQPVPQSSGADATSPVAPSPVPSTSAPGCQIDAPDNSGSISCNPSVGCVIMAANNSGSISCGGDGMTATLSLTAANDSSYRLEFSPPVVAVECSTICTDRNTFVKTPISETITLSGTVSDICVNNAVAHIVTCVGRDDNGAVVITDSLTLAS